MEKLYKDVEKAQKIAATFFISSITALAVLILFYAVFEKSPLTYKNLPFPVVNQVIHPGDRVPYRVDRCNKSSVDTHYTITRYLQSLDGNPSIILGSTDIVFEPGCRSIISEVNTLPTDLPSGKYKLSGVAEIQGVVKPLKVEWYTEPFVVSSR